MKAYIEKKQFSEIYSMMNGLFVNIKGKNVSQFVKISAVNNQIIFEYFNEKDYLKMFYDSNVEVEGSALVRFDVLKIINSLNGEIKISHDDKKSVLHFSDTKRVLNIPQSDIEFELQHPFGKQRVVEIKADIFSNEAKFLKTSTKNADVSQDRFKNILISFEDEKCWMVAASGHLLTLVELPYENSDGEKFYIPRSITNCLTSLKKKASKDEIVKISNFESYHTQIEIGNVLVHSSYETKEFVDYSRWKNVPVKTAVVIKKKDLMDCINSLLLLKPFLDKIEFCVSEKYLKFYSVKNSEIDMRALVDISKAKNPLKYRGSFSGKEIKDFISRLPDDENIVMGLDESFVTNIIKTKDSRLVCNTLTMKGM